MRKCYSAPAKFFADDTSRSNRINWYFVPDGTPIYDQPTIFTPGIDNPDWMSDNLPEHVQLRTISRKYNDGVNLWGTTGLHVDGDAQDFLGQSLHTKYMIGGNPPVNPCGLVRQEDVGLLFRVVPLTVTGKYPADFLGLHLGVQDVAVGNYIGLQVAGLHLGLLETLKKPEKESLLAGLHLGVIDEAVGSYVGLDLVGLHLGCREGVPTIDVCGLALGITDGIPAEGVGSDVIGLHVGTIDAEPAEGVGSDFIGLHVGVIELAPEAGVGTDAAGLHIGVIDAAPDAGIGTDAAGLHVGNTELVPASDGTDSVGLHLGLIVADPAAADLAGLHLGVIEA